ncbi:MAG TPA: cysteine dioxygenase family protein [Mycobacteriales bacterium]|nr:cysteine dioxygenase family protein [Mycobacteriales bacterium]
MTTSLQYADDLDYLSPDGRPPAAPYLHATLVNLAPQVAALTPDRPLWAPAELARLTGLLAHSVPESLRRLVRHDPERRWYGRLALTEDVEVWLIGWAPGQGTPPHGHGGASGAFTVLAGQLAETHQEGPGVLRRAVLDPLTTSAFGPQRVHQVTNRGVVEATSVHAYSPPLLPAGELASIDAGRGWDD